MSSQTYAQCVSALEAAASAPIDQRLRRVVNGCASACPGLGEIDHETRKDDMSRREFGLPTASSATRPNAPRRDTPTMPGAGTKDTVTQVLAGCQLFCTEQAATAWRRTTITRRFEVLERECGVRPYGLDKSDRHLLSASWLVLHRIARWLKKHRSAADRQTAAALDDRASRVLFPVAPPTRVDGLYQLTASLQSEPIRATSFAIVTAEDIRAGVIARARLSPGLLEPVTDRFPGQILSRPAADYRAIASRAKGSAAALRDGRQTSSTPLVLIDRDTGLGHLLRAINTMEVPRFTLGVAGYSALAHPIEIELLGPRGSAAPLLRMRRDEWVVIGDTDEEVHIPAGPSGRARLARALHALSVRLAPQNKIEVEVTDRASITDLVAMLDIVAESKFAVALLKLPGAAAGRASPGVPVFDR